MVIHAYNPIAHETEAVGSQPRVYSETISNLLLAKRSIRND